MRMLVLLLSFLFLPVLASAEGITNPQVVDMMRVSIVENGTIDVTGLLAA